MFCKKCGNQIDDDSAFCYKCGTAVSNVTQEKVQSVQTNAPMQNVQTSTPAQNVQTSTPAQNVQTNAPAQNVQTSAPAQNVQTSTPAQNVQTNSPTSKPKIQKISARGQEVTSTAPIESKYKTGKIITLITAVIIPFFVPLSDENFWLMFIITVAFCVLLAWNGLSAVTMFIIRNIETLLLASYIESENAEQILKLIADPLAKKDIDARLCKKGANVILIDYQGRKYELYFFKEGYFNIAPDRPVSMYGIEGMKIIKMPFIYEHSLEDVPVIAYCVQEILKNA